VKLRTPDVENAQLFVHMIAAPSSLLWWFWSVLLVGTIIPRSVGQACSNGEALVKIGEGQCNGGVGGSGEHYCLVGGACNENGTPSMSTTQRGVTCPGQNEYLLCTESTTITRATCKRACEQDTYCVGFLLSYHAALNSARCELHTKKITFAAKPLECYTFTNNAFTLIGKGACRTKDLTVSGAQQGTRYGDMSVAWVDNLDSCQTTCRSSTPRACIGIEYHRTAGTAGKFKCEVHYQELSASQMSIFECWACRSSVAGIAHQSSIATQVFVVQAVRLLIFASGPQQMF